MEITVEHSDGICQMLIAGEMCIYEAHEIKDELIASVAESNELEIDLSQVSEMDSAGLQLLLLAKKMCTDSNKTLRLVSHSEAALEVIDSYHMASFFGDPMVIPDPKKASNKNAKDGMA